jgi:hypothetical protein
LSRLAAYQILVRMPGKKIKVTELEKTPVTKKWGPIRWLVVALVAFELMLALAAVGVYLWGPKIAAYYITKKIEGLTGVQCHATLDNIHSTQADLHLIFPEFQLKTGPIRLEWEPDILWKLAGNLQATLHSDGTSGTDMAIGKHSIRATIGLQRFEVISLDLHAQADWASRGKMRLEGPRADITLDRNQSSIVLAMMVSKKEAATLSYVGTPLSTQSQLSGEGPLLVVLPSAKVSSHWKWAIDLSSNQITSHFSEGAFSGLGQALKFSGTAQWNPPLWSAQLDTKLQPDKSPSPLWNALALSIHGQGQYPELKGSGKIADQKAAEVVPFQFQFNAATQSGSAQTAKHWDFKEGWDIANVSDAMGFLKLNEGSMDLSAKANYTPQSRLSASMQLQIKDASGTLSDIPVEHLNTSVDVPEFFPLKVKPFSISMARAGNKAPLEDLKLEVSIQNQSAVVVPSIARWAGGQVSALPFDIRFHKPVISTTLSVDQLDLQTLLTGAEVNYLAAKGKVNGKIPLKYVNQYLEIHGATLESENGWLRYADSGLKISGNIDTMEKFQQLVSQGQQALVMKALDNFEFKRLHAKIHRVPATGLGAKVQISGRNPNLARGQPFEFNISVAGQLEQLMKRSFFLMSEE